MARKTTSVLVFFILVLLDSPNDVRGFRLETSSTFSEFVIKSKFSIYHDMFHTSDVDNELLGKDLIEKVSGFLDSISPPHQIYLLFDNIFEDVANSLLQYYGKIGTTVATNFIRGSDVIENLPSTKMALGNTIRRHVFVLCTLENLKMIFSEISSRNLESRWTWWILVTVEKNVSLIIEQLLREGTQVIIVEIEEDKQIRLLSSRVDTKGLVRFEEAGVLQVTLTSYKFRIFLDVFEDLDKSYSNFKGRQLTVTANNNHPFILFEKLSDGDLLPLAGFEYAIVKALGEALNFTFRLIEPADGKWGGPLPNGTVVGMIGVVARREAQFAICEISITGLREEVIDFTYPHYIESLTLISRAPMEKNRSFAAFAPFTPMTWLYISLSLLLIGPVVSIESWLVMRYFPAEGDAKNVSDILFNMFRSLVKQENLLEAKNSPQKLTILFWYLFCFIISVLYSGMLTATLIKPSFEKPINGLIDLPAAVKDGFTLVVTGDTSMEYMFKDAPSGIYADTWKLFNHKDRSKSFVRYSIDSFDKIVDDKLVVINGQLTSRYHGAKRGSSQFYLARDTFAPQYYGAPTYSGSPFLPVFNKMFSYMAEGGLITKWVENEFGKVATKNIILKKSGPRAFTIKHLQAAFYTLPIGFLIAAAAFVIEFIVAHIM